MIFILNLFISCAYLCFVRVNSWKSLFIKLFPVILIWVLIIGGQYGIGADYFNYLKYFSNPLVENRFEPLFSLVSKSLYQYGFKGQDFFFIYAFINALVVFIAIKRAGVKRLALFYFLLVTVSTYFNNQMNGIRQCIAVPLTFWAFIEFYENKLRGIILVLLAMGFHYSAIICIAFLYIKPISNILTKYPRILLLVTLCASFVDSNNELNVQLMQLLPESIREETTYEMMYSNDGAMAASTNLLYKISKLILIPVYWYSLRLLKTDDLTNKEKIYYKFGLLSYSLRCILLINNLIGRFSYYFWIPSIFPIYYLGRKYWREKKTAYFVLLLVYCSLTYFAKVLIGEREYKSSFIYFMQAPFY